MNDYLPTIGDFFEKAQAAWRWHRQYGPIRHPHSVPHIKQLCLKTNQAKIAEIFDMSVAELLDFRNDLRNRNRVAKNLFTSRDGGTKVTHFHGRSDEE